MVSLKVVDSEQFNLGEQTNEEVEPNRRTNIQSNTQTFSPTQPFVYVCGQCKDELSRSMVAGKLFDRQTGIIGGRNTEVSGSRTNKNGCTPSHADPPSLVKL